jgi:hypothetical protein
MYIMSDVNRARDDIRIVKFNPVNIRYMTVSYLCSFLEKTSDNN